MAELADAIDSGSNGRKAVQVQVLLPAPSSLKPSVYAGLRDFLVSRKPHAKRVVPKRLLPMSKKRASMV